MASPPLPNAAQEWSSILVSYSRRLKPRETDCILGMHSGARGQPQRQDVHVSSTRHRLPSMESAGRTKVSTQGMTCVDSRFSASFKCFSQRIVILRGKSPGGLCSSWILNMQRQGDGRERRKACLQHHLLMEKALVLLGLRLKKKKKKRSGGI